MIAPFRDSHKLLFSCTWTYSTDYKADMLRTS